MRATATANGETTRGTVAGQTATIRYDASRRSYTLSTGGGSITFGPGDLDAASSNSVATVYTRKSGSTTDVLTLTKPGKTGLATYQYVGSAFWEHVQVSGSSGNGSVDAFVYGMPTAASAVPRSGTGAYEVTLIGVESIPAGSAAMAGSGGAIVDFGTGAIRISGMMKGIYFSGSDIQFDATASMSSSANGFGGTIKWSDAANFSGALNGEFFGPAAQELGAVFNATAPDGRVAVGTITGRQGTIGNEQFTNGTLVNTQIFSTSARRLDFKSLQKSVNSDTVGDFTDQALRREPLKLTFDAITKKYTVSTPDTSYSPIALGSDSDFQDDDTALMLTNTRTYAATGIFRKRTGGTSADRQISYGLDYFIYGMPTLADALPRTGLADYKVQVEGLVVDNAYSDALSANGEGVLSVDFSTGRLDLSTLLSMRERDIISGHNPQSATGVFKASGTISSTANTFSGNLTLDGIGNYSGTFDGNFFGPTAQEVAATWSAADGADKAIGTIIGGRDASLTAARKPLVDYTTPTTFTVIALRNHGIVDPTKLDYDPATGKYVLRIDTSMGTGAIPPYQVRFDPSIIDPARTDASRTWYERGTGISGYVSKPGSDNPVIQLTYSTFADLQVRTSAPNQTEPLVGQYFLIYGNRTPYAMLPRFGSATYEGIIRARGKANAISYEGTFSGTATATADFADMKLGATVNIVADNAAASSVGSFSFGADIITLDGVTTAFRGFSASGEYYGEIEGGFFGPAVDEVGATWFVRRNGLAEGVNIGGVLMGKKN